MRCTGEATRKLNANLTVDGKYFWGPRFVVNKVPSSTREDKLIYKLLEACVMLSDFPKHGQVIPTR